MGASLQSSAADLIPIASTSEQSLPGLANDLTPFRKLMGHPVADSVVELCHAARTADRTDRPTAAAQLDKTWWSQALPIVSAAAVTTESERHPSRTTLPSVAPS